MTAIEQAIKRAVEKGGYLSDSIFYNEEEKVLFGRRIGFAMNRKHETFFDLLFWQALGKAKGWEKKVIVRRGTVIGNFCTPCSREHPRGECFEEMGFEMDYLNPWAYHWHHFIDHLAEGKNAESFFATLV